MSLSIIKTQKLNNETITPIKTGNDNSVGPFISEEKDYIHILVFFHPDVSKEVIESAAQGFIDKTLNFTLTLPRESGSKTTSVAQNLWSILIKRPSNWSKGKQIKFEVNFNEKDSDKNPDLTEPRRGTKVIITD